jgi:hypothetical protein
MNSGTEPRKNDRRISILSHPSQWTDTLPTPQDSLITGRWL